jgi:hypothetical protein
VREGSSAQSQPLWYRAYLYVLSPVRTAMIRSCLWCGSHDDFHAGEGCVVLPAALLAVHVPEAVTVALLKLISRLHVRGRRCWTVNFTTLCWTLYCTCCVALCCIALYCTELYCTVLYCTVPYCAVLYRTLLYCTVLYCTILYCTVLHTWGYGQNKSVDSSYHYFREYLFPEY